MSESDADVVVIGAGLCGLSLARDLGRRGRRALVLEKSRGVGGRLATRRTERARFDHGAQFYVLRADTESAHAAWTAAGVVRPWWTEGGHTRFNAPGGMTVLAKALARDADVRFEHKVTRIERGDDGWRTHGEDGRIHRAVDVVLTCPIPQSVELLRKSEIAVPAPLTRVVYAPALVALVEDPRGSANLAGEFGYRTEPGADVQSIADQFVKGVSPSPAWTVTMTPAFSRAHLDDPRAEEVIRARLGELDPGFTCARIDLKVWRFAQPETWGPDLTTEVAPGLHLAGDGFGGPSVNGALRSAGAVLDRVASGSALQ